MRVLIIGGMHGNEPLGIDIVRRIQSNPVKNVDAVLGNDQAIAQNCRYIKTDLNRSFPGSLNGEDFEQRRAQELLQLCASYDVVLDFHNTHCPNNDCGFVGESAKQDLFDVSAWLGLKRIIVADYDCINKFAPNCLSVEISLASPGMDVEGWVEKLGRLASLESLPVAKNIETFRFVYRLTLEDRDMYDLPDKQLKAFEPIDKELASALGVLSPAYPIFIADAYTPYNYGGLMNSVSNR